MGNTRIQDSATGNIMSLSPGFIPVGMKEHGGIMYIASVNKDGQGEIGTIPSPIIRDIYKDQTVIGINSTIPFTPSDPLTISHKFYPADRFILHLDLDASNSTFVGNLKEGSNENPEDAVLSRSVITSIFRQTGQKTQYTANLKAITNPIISYSPNIQPDNITYTKGIYSLKLYSCNDLGKNWLQADSTLYEALPGAKYWFQHDTSTNFPTDLHSASLDGSLKPYPTNLKPGYLSVALEPEKPGKFGMIPRLKYPHNVPYTYKYFGSNDGGELQDLHYYSYISGFYYTTDSGIYIDHFKSEVIDEASGQPLTLYYPKTKGSALKVVQNTWYDGNFKNIVPKSVPGYQPIQLSLTTSTLDTPFSGSTDVIIADSQVGYLQRLSSHKENGQDCFLLTNLLNIHTHTNSTLKSEQGNTYHTGLFCVDLGQNWNRWLRLETDYYDQYDNKQGTFVQRFNPYLNDVFGTNLLFEGVEQAEAKVMGKQIKTEEQILQNEEDEYTIPYRSTLKYTDTNYVGNDPNTDTTDIDISGSSRNAVKQRTCLLFKSDNYPSNVSFNYSGTTNYGASLSFSVGQSKSELEPSKTYSYLYTDLQQRLQCQFEPSDSTYFSISPSNNTSTKYRLWYSMYNLSSGSNTPDHTNDWDVTGQHTFTSNEVYLKYGESYITLPYSITWATSEDSYSRYPHFQFRCQTSLIDPSFSKVIDVTQLDENGTYNFKTMRYENLGFYFSQIENMKGGFDRDWAAMLYTIKKGDDHNFLNLQFKTKGTKTLTLLPSTLTPSYAIVPYFRLTGKNEQGKTVYVNKLHYTDDVWYECNFELNENDSSPRTYLNLSNNDEGTITDADSSYHVHHAKTVSGAEILTATLTESGIYVLNISNAVKTSKTNCELKITMGGDSLYDGNLLTNTSSIESGVTQDYYQPIVIVLTEASNATLEFKFSSKFTYQDIGLYKLKDAVVTGGDSDKSHIEATTKAYRFSEYQQMIQDNTQKFTNKSEQYQYIQKYGVFFQQAYCYLEGLVDNNGEVQPIQKPDKSGYYSKVAYQPSQSYIINYMFDDKFTNTYSCMYAMEEKVLGDPKGSKFIFWPKEQNLLTAISNNISNSTEAVEEGINGYLRYKN